MLVFSTGPCIGHNLRFGYAHHTRFGSYLFSPKLFVEDRINPKSGEALLLLL